MSKRRNIHTIIKRLHEMKSELGFALGSASGPEYHDKLDFIRKAVGIDERILSSRAIPPSNQCSLRKCVKWIDRRRPSRRLLQ